MWVFVLAAFGALKCRAFFSACIIHHHADKCRGGISQSCFTLRSFQEKSHIFMVYTKAYIVWKGVILFHLLGLNSQNLLKPLALLLSLEYMLCVSVSYSNIYRAWWMVLTIPLLFLFVSRMITLSFFSYANVILKVEILVLLLWHHKTDLVCPWGRKGLILSNQLLLLEH